MKNVLKIPTFRRMALAYGLNELAWSVGTLALAVLVYRRTGSALGATAFFLCSQVVPAFFTPWLVGRLDQRSPRRVLPGLYAVEAVIFGALAWMTANFSLPAVLILVVIDGSLSLVARALGRAAANEILGPVDLVQEGNALNNLIFSACYMGGPAIGGVVVATGGTVSALFANCGLFAAVALVLATAHGLPGAADNPEPARNRVRSTLRYVREDRTLRRMLLLMAAGMVAFSISVPVEVVLAQHTLHAGAGGYGALMSGWGAGAVVGSLAFARWRRLPGQFTMAASGVALAAGFAVMGLAPTIVVAVVGAAIGGAGNGGIFASSKTLLQQYTPQRWMAMITGLNEGAIQAAPALGITLGGAIAAASEPRVALGIAAVGSLAYVFGVWALIRPSLLPDPPSRTPDRPHEPRRDHALAGLEVERGETVA